MAKLDSLAEGYCVNRPMPIELRPVIDHDFEYCRHLYFVEMRWIIEELNLDRTTQETSFKQQWNPAQVRMIVFDGIDVGWLQAMRQNDEFQRTAQRHFS